MSRADEFVEANQAYARDFDQGDLPMPPGRQVAWSRMTSFAHC